MDTAFEHIGDQVLLDLLARTDDLGVLSVYADVRTDPRTTRERSAIDLKNRFRELQRRVAAGDTGHSRQLSTALERIWPAVEALTEPVASGRGRVLFAALGGQWNIRVSGAMPVTNRIVLDNRPFIHPLLELLDEGRPAGVVQIAPTTVRVHEWRMGRMNILAELQADEREATHERAGQIGGGPPGQFHTPVREQRQARKRELSERFLASAAEALDLADKRQWEQVLLTGADRPTNYLAGRLASRLGIDAMRDPRVIGGLDGAELAAAVTDRLHAEHAAREQRLLRRIREAGHAGNGALGASEVAAALNSGRVAQLVYDPAVRYAGSVGPDGVLYAGAELGPAGGDALAESRLTERLVERALATGAQVTPVEGAADDTLREAQGIAALLRW